MSENEVIPASMGVDPFSGVPLVLTVVDVLRKTLKPVVLAPAVHGEVHLGRAGGGLDAARCHRRADGHAGLGRRRGAAGVGVDREHTHVVLLVVLQAAHRKGSCRGRGRQGGCAREVGRGAELDAVAGDGAGAGPCSPSHVQGLVVGDGSLDDRGRDGDARHGRCAFDDGRVARLDDVVVRLPVREPGVREAAHAGSEGPHEVGGSRHEVRGSPAIDPPLRGVTTAGAPGDPHLGVARPRLDVRRGLRSRERGRDDAARRGRLVPAADGPDQIAVRRPVLGRLVDEREGLGRQGLRTVQRLRQLDRAARRPIDVEALGRASTAHPGERDAVATDGCRDRLRPWCGVGGLEAHRDDLLLAVGQADDRGERVRPVAEAGRRPLRGLGRGATHEVERAAGVRAQRLVLPRLVVDVEADLLDAGGGREEDVLLAGNGPTGQPVRAHAAR